MLNEIEKIEYIEKYLNSSNSNYADSFKNDIYIFIDECKIENIRLKFLSQLNSKKEIENWVDKLTSRIVLKFDEESEQISDFISDYIELG